VRICCWSWWRECGLRLLGGSLFFGGAGGEGFEDMFWSFGSFRVD